MIYELTENKKVVYGVELTQIRLKEDHPIYGKKGTLGGWIEKESNLQDNAWVYGNARVLKGQFEQSPIQIQGTKHFINEDGDGFVSIGCKSFHISEWLENFEEIGKSKGYSEKQIKEYYYHLKHIELLINNR